MCAVIQRVAAVETAPAVGFAMLKPMRICKAFAVLACCVGAAACSGKTTTVAGPNAGDGGEPSSGGAGAGGSPAGGGAGVSGAAMAGSPGSAGVGDVSSGQPCAPEGAQHQNTCNACTCSQGAWLCSHDSCPPPRACGARAGDTCDANEYCAYVAGQLCGAADATATCKPRPKVCPRIYAPVCGCDQVTFSNDCDAAVHGSGVSMSGPCAKQ